jgi:hypothetical protein
MNPKRTKRAFELVFFAVASVPAPAFASLSYPQEIKDQLSLAHLPQCTLCHKSNSGGKGTVTKPFGVEIRQLGAEGKSPGSMVGALGQYDRLRYSVDGDFAPDVQELRDGTDPNEPDVEGEGGAGGVVPPSIDDLPTPQTGCSVRRPSESNTQQDDGEMLGALALASSWFAGVFLVRRARRRAL